MHHKIHSLTLLKKQSKVLFPWRMLQRFIGSKKLTEIPKSIVYETTGVLESIKSLNFILISLRKMGDFSIDDEKFDLKNEIFNFIIEEQLLDKLAEIRFILEKEFEDFPRVGEQSFLETITEDIKYWTPKQ